MKNVRVARRYAGALMAVAEGAKSLETIATELSMIAETLKSSAELRRLAASPVVSPGQKVAVFRELFGKKTGKDTMAFLELMIAKQRESHLADIIEQFGIMCDEKFGIVAVDVTSAIEFTPSQEKGLQTELERYTKKKVRIRIAVDKAIKGGLVVRVGDTVLDASVRRQLEILKIRLLTGGADSN